MLKIQDLFRLSLLAAMLVIALIAVAANLPASPQFAPIPTLMALSSQAANTSPSVSTLPTKIPSASAARLPDAFTSSWVAQVPNLRVPLLLNEVAAANLASENFVAPQQAVRFTNGSSGLVQSDVSAAVGDMALLESMSVVNNDTIRGAPITENGLFVAEATSEATPEPTPPQNNDLIENATIITSLPYTNSQPLLGMTRSASDPTPSCWMTTYYQTIWYRYTPTVDQRVLFDGAGSDNAADSKLAIYSGVPGSLTERGCSTQSYTKGIDLSLTAGQTYYIVGGKTSSLPTSTLQMTLNAIVVVPAPNDEITSATVISSLPFSTQQDVYGATFNVTDPGSTCPGAAVSYGSNSVWFAYTSPVTQGLILNPSGSTFSGSILIFTGEPGSLTLHACSTNSSILTPVNFSAQAATTYYIMVSEYNSTPLALPAQLKLNIASMPSVANDNFANALEVTGLPFEHDVDAYNATSEATDPAVNRYCLYNPIIAHPNTIWYRYTAPADQSLNITMETTPSYRKLIVMYTLQGSTLTRYACSGESFLTTKVQGGVTYYVMIGSEEGSNNFPLDHPVPGKVIFQSPPVANDLIEDATVVNRFPYIVEQNVYGSTMTPTDPTLCTTNSQSNSVWFKYTPTENQPILLDASDSTYDTAIKVFTQGAGSTLVEQECAYELVGMQAQAGATYIIMISQKRDADTPLLDPGAVLRFRITSPIVSNDLVENPIVIPSTGIPYSNTQDVVGSSMTLHDPIITSGSCRSSYIYALDRPNTVWYEFTATSTRTMIIDTTPSDYSTYIELPDQNVCGYGVVSFRAQAGTTYRIKVAYRNAITAEPLNESAMLRFTLRKSIPNDAQADATRIETIPFTHTQDVTDATIAGEPYSPGCIATTQSVWFRYVPDANQTILIDTTGSNYNTVVAVYLATTLGGCAPLGENHSNATQFTLNVRANKLYYFKVMNASDTPAPDPATLQLSITETTNSYLLEDARVIPTAALSYQDNQDLGNAKPDIDAPYIVCNEGPYSGRQNRFWYRYTPPIDMAVDLSSLVTIGYITLNVYTADNMQLVTCTPGWSYHAADVRFTALGGRSYYIFVGMDTHNSSGDSPWLNQLTFSAEVNAKPTALTPTDVSHAARPQFTWLPVVGADRYDLSITSIGGSILTFSVDPAVGCTPSLCSFTPDVDLLEAQYQWYVRGWNSLVGYTQPSSTLFFSDCPTFPYTVPAGDTENLINAINCANSNGAGTDDVINLTNSTYTLTAVDNSTQGDNGLPAIAAAADAGTLTINGNGATIARSTVGGTPNFRFFFLASGANLALNNLTLSNGVVQQGGAILSLSGSLTITGSVFSNNSTVGTGDGGAIYSDGTGILSIASTAFTGNHAGYEGGAIYSDSSNTSITNSVFESNSADGYGGAVFLLSPSASVTDTAFSGNTASSGAGLFNLGSDTVLTIRGSTFVNNTTPDMLLRFGGAIMNAGHHSNGGGGGNVTITNSTLTGNSSGDKGGAVWNGGTMTINSSTIYGNSASTGGGLFNLSGYTLKLGSTIVAGGTASGSGPDLSGSITSLGFNAIGDTTGAVITGNTDADRFDAAASPLNLGPLANNGGPTQTMALNAGSVAIGYGNCSSLPGVPAVTIDQRGVSRKTPCDMGAYEYTLNTAPTISNITLQVTDEDTPTGEIAFTIGDAEMPPTYLTVTGTSSNTTRVANENIVFGGSGANRTVRIMPSANKFGNVVITVTVSDGDLTASDTFTLTISPVNDPPTITNVPDQQIRMNSQTYGIDFYVTDVETSASSLVVTAASSNQVLVPDSGIVLNSSGSRRTVNVIPAADQSGTTEITLMVSDTEGAVASEIFMVTVGGDALFSDGFESGSLNAWTSSLSDGGDLSVTTGAALMGSAGLQALIDDTAPIFVNDDTPTRETRYRARFLFDPNTLTMANGDNFNLFLGYQGTSTQVLQVQMRRSGSTYQVRVAAVDDGATWSYSSFVTITDAPHLLELDWQAATTAGANDGALVWWLDEAAQASVTGVDNDTRSIDRVRLGAAAGIDVGTSGTVFFDAFISRRESYIGRLVATPTLVSPPTGTFIPREVAPTLTWDTGAGLEYYAEFGSLNSGWMTGGTWSPGLQPQGPYTWRVKARDASGEESAWSLARTLTIRPGVPTSLQGVTVSDTAINLTWTASIDAPDGITGYRVFRDGVQTATVDNVTTGFMDNTVAACAVIRYKVRAFKGGVSSLDSNTVTVNTPCDPIFSDGFESGSFSAWSSKAVGGGDLAVIAAAQLTGNNYGMRARINDLNDLYVQDDTPNAEGRYRARFYFDPNSVTMANNDRFTLLQGLQGTSTLVVQVEMRRSGSNYQLRAGIRDDGAGWTYTSYYTISDSPHIVEFDWQAASANGVNDGGLTFWLDESLMQTLSSIDNDTRRIDTVRLGAVTGLDVGTSGVVYFDAFRSTRLSYIGAEIGGLGMFVAPEEPMAVPTAEVTPEATDEPTAEPTAEVTPEPSATPTIEPTAAPTETPTPEPSETPAVEPTAEPTLLPFSVPVFQTMDDGAPLWSASAGWQLSADAAYSGLGWQASASGSPETLTLTVSVNLAGTSAPTLTFQSRLVSASLPEVQVSLDGAAWQTVSTVTPSLNWALVSVDLSAYAGQTVRVQFVWSSSAAGETWQVDEVTLSDGIAQPPIEPTLPPVQPTFEIEPTGTPGAPNVEPPVYLPTTVPREGGALPDAPADLPPAPGS